MTGAIFNDNIMSMIDRLTTIQRDLGETDDQFSKRLGIKRAIYQMIRTKKVKPGYKTLPAILKAFPGLVKYIQNDSGMSVNDDLKSVQGVN